MEFKKVLITPDYARKILKTNKSNRVLRMPTILRYSKDMSNGNWKTDTAETIKISDEGNLIDGQHRLHAVIHSNQSIFFHVAYNIDRDVFKYLDTGASRSASDIFKIDGIKNAHSVTSIIQTYNRLKISGLRTLQKNQNLTNAELLDVYYENPEYWQYVCRKSDSWYDSFAKILSQSTIGGFFALFNDINKDDSENFVNQLCTGHNITNQTIELLRKRLIQEKISIKKTSPLIRNSMILKTWNLFRKNESVKVLKFDPEKESLPKPI
jgi:hypothetical protein